MFPFVKKAEPVIDLDKLDTDPKGLYDEPSIVEREPTQEPVGAINVPRGFSGKFAPIYIDHKGTTAEPEMTEEGRKYFLKGCIGDHHFKVPCNEQVEVPLEVWEILQPLVEQQKVAASKVILV